VPGAQLGEKAFGQPPVSEATHWSKASLLFSGLSTRPWAVHCTIASASDRIGVRMVVGSSVGRTVGSSVGRIVGTAVVGATVGVLVGRTLVGPAVG
jgi:hypothetical protein